MRIRTGSGKSLTHDGHVVQTCPFLKLQTPAYNKKCVNCHEHECSRMSAVGLDLNGNPLPENERPECGAETRSNSPCKMQVTPGKERCRLHGGLSTGPKTIAGRERIRSAQKRRWAKNKPEKAGVDRFAIEAPPTRITIAVEANEPEVKRRKRWRRTKRISPMAL